MGCSASVGLTAEELEEYSSLLYLRKSDILQLYIRLKEAIPDAVMDRDWRFSAETIKSIFPEFQWNPFFDRMLAVFSSLHDNCLSFEDILDIYSALSPRCPNHVKADWAFRIFDIDADGQIGPEDIKHVIDILIHGSGKEQREIQDFEKDEIANSILDDLDLDKTGGVTSVEFVHAVLKLPEFTHAFRLRV